MLVPKRKTKNDYTGEAYFELIHTLGFGCISIQDYKYWTLPTVLPSQRHFFDDNMKSFKGYLSQKYDREYINMPPEIHDVIFMFVIEDKDDARRHLVHDCCSLAGQLSMSNKLVPDHSLEVCFFSPLCQINIDMTLIPFKKWSSNIVRLKDSKYDVDYLYEYVIHEDNFEHILGLCVLISMNEDELRYCFEEQQNYLVLILYAKLLDYIDKVEYVELLRGYHAFIYGAIEKDAYDIMFSDWSMGILSVIRQTWRGFYDPFKYNFRTLSR